MSRYFDDAGTTYLSASNAAVTSTPLTLACWFYSDDDAIEQILVSVGVSGSNNNRWSLLIAGQAAGDPVRAQARTTSPASADSTTGYSVNTWHHACGIFVGSAERYAYIDGGSKGSSTGSRAPSGVNHHRIGASHDGSTSKASGRICEVGIWNVALTDAEVAALARGISPLRIRPANLVRYYPVRGTESPEPCVRSGNSVSLTGSPAVADHAPVQALFWAPAFVPPSVPTTPVSQSIPSAWESMQDVQRPLSSTFEGAGRMVAATFTSFESTALASSSGVVALESVRGLLAGGPSSFESLLQTTSPRIVSLESLMGLRPTAVAAWESLLGLSQGIVTPWESGGAAASPVSQSLTASYEVLGLTAQQRLAAFESLLYIQQLRQAAFEVSGAPPHFDPLPDYIAIADARSMTAVADARSMDVIADERETVATADARPMTTSADARPMEA
jgi:hypothetical protein